MGLNPVIALGAIVALAASETTPSTPSTPSTPAGGGDAPPTPSTPSTPRPPTDYHRSASAYADAKASMMLARWNNSRIQTAVRYFAARYLPGAPPQAVLCFGVSSQGPSEDTGGSLSERGLFNVETRFIDQWAADSETLSVLGRRYDPSRAAYAADLEAQVYTGCRRYRAALDAAAAELGALLSPSTPVDAWAAWCAVDAYSAGAGVLGRLARASLTASTARAARPQAIASTVARAAASGAAVGGVPMRRGQGGAAWAVVRPLQRFYAGKDLARATGGDLAWFDLAAIPATDDVLLSTWAHGT